MVFFLHMFDRDRSYARNKVHFGFVDLTDTDGKTIADMLSRVPSFQALPLDVQEHILSSVFISGMMRQVEECSTVSLVHASCICVMLDIPRMYT